MAYQPTTWINEETPINADEMNNIDAGIREALDGIEVDPSVILLFETDGWTPPA